MEFSRKTRESSIKVSVEPGQINETVIDTGLEFLNHMLETIAWRSGLNISVEVKSERFRLRHVIAEDTGIVFGKALAKLVEEKIAGGINGAGCAYAVIDEAKAFAAVSVEGRANCFVERQCEGAKLERVEDMLSCDLVAFLEGFAQGAKATIRVDLEKGLDSHHAWEAGFRALGEALRLAFTENKRRKGLIAGTKGVME